MSFDQDDFGSYGGGSGARRQPSNNQNVGYQTAVDPQEIEFTNKCQAIESGLYKLNANVVNLKKMVEAMGTPRETHELRNQIQNLRSTIMNSIHSVETSIKELNSGGSSKRRLQQDQLGKRMQGMLVEFKGVVEVAMQKEKKSLAVNRERAASFKKPGYDEDDDDGENESMMAAHRQREQEQEQMRAQMKFNQDMIIEREEGMKEIESTMVEINDIFRDLSMAIHDQGSMLDSIEANMTSADTHVERGTGQLVKANDYQKKARSKMMCLLVIVAIVAAILTIVLVTQLRH